MNLLNRLKCISNLHLYTLVHAYDPILDSENPLTFGQLPKLQAQFIAIIIACLLIGLYGTLLLEYDAKGGIEWDQLLRSQHIFTRQIFLRSMWPQTDMLSLVYFAGSFGLYVALLATPTIEPKYRMYRSGETIVVMGGKSECS